MMESVDKKIVLASWVAASEPVEWIAARTEQLLEGLTRSLGVPHWEMSLPSAASDDPASLMHRRVRWEGDKNALVARCPVSARFGSAGPDEGYSLHLYGRTSHMHSVKIRVRAGDSSKGKRQPSHSVHIEVVASEGYTVPHDLAGTMIGVVVAAFEPLVASQVDIGIVELARRGGWMVSPSYRLWLADDVLSGAVVPAEMTSERVGEGWLYTVADDVEPERVVAIHEDFRAMNGLDLLPH